MPARRIQLLTPPSTREPSRRWAQRQPVFHLQLSAACLVQVLLVLPPPSLPATSTAPVFPSAPGPFSSSPSLPDAAAFVAHPLLPSPSPPTNPPVAGVLVASKSAPPLDVSASRGPSQLLSAPIPASHTSTATLLLAPLAAERRILASLHSDVVRPWLPLLSDTPA